jgi:diguanylate cyclase (GGDEF)-like protein
LFFFFIFFLLQNKNVDSGFLWFVFFPLFVIPTNGFKRGTLLTVFFFSVVFVLAYMGIGSWQEGEWNIYAYIRFVAVYTVLVYVLAVNEWSLEHSHRLFLKKKQKEQKLKEKLKESAEKDYLTKLYNRRKLHKILNRKIKEAQRYNRSFCVAILDIDFFKKINDTYGHNKGDEVLKELAEILQKNLRETDIIGRWGGEEFLLILDDASLEDAYKKCETIRKKIEINRFEEVLKVTCSIGVAEYSGEESIFDEIIEKADFVLYQAKEHGRNRVEQYKAA